MKLKYFFSQLLLNKAILFVIAISLLLVFSGLLLKNSPVARADATVGNGTSTSCTEDSLNTALTQGGHITFNCGSDPLTIPITSLKTIQSNTNLDGSGAKITLDGNAAGQLLHGMFHINSGISFTVSNLSLINAQSDQSGAAIFSDTQSTLTVTNCLFNNNISNISSTYDGGGAIYLSTGATGVITNCQFMFNKGPSGGAINSSDSSLSITNSTFSNNEATASDGGAIYSHSLTSNLTINFTIESSQVITNVAKMQGGGISTFYAAEAIKKANLNNTTVAHNNAGVAQNSGGGGGIYHGQGLLTVTNSAIYDNSVPTQGGGIYIGGNTLATQATISNTTIANNQAYNAGQGGGIFKAGGILNLTHVTVASNTSGQIGGGIDFGSGGIATTDITLKNSIVANNTSYSDPYYSDCGGMVSDGGYNLQENIPTSNISNCTAGITRADPKLAQLADAGGPTASIGLLTGSPAIDAIPASSCPLNQDQRGVARPLGTKCDIGAFEGIIKLPTLSKAFNPSTIGLGGDSTLIFTVGNPSTTGTVLSGIAYSDSLPAGLKVSSLPNIVDNCATPSNNPVISFSGNNSTINVSNVSVAAGQTCTISVDVTPQNSGTLTNTITTISATATGLSTINAQASLTVTNLAPYLTIGAVTASSVTLNWNLLPAGATGFQLERSQNDRNHYQVLLALSAGTNTYTDSGVSAGKLYYYRVRATTSAGFSPYSNEVSLITPSSIVVTNPDETGTGNSGTLLWALNQVGTSGDRAITFNLSSGTTVTVASNVTLPPVETGVTIGGSCQKGPWITIKGARLQLKGDVTLYGLILAGPRPTGSNAYLTSRLDASTAGYANHFSCFKITP
ncbi:MAG TPA: choice-of-anchor Q domain-containing protein [Chloroflexia bacterium]|nr:choice-of-anchor Q domain-containing protein [Chloroflexia bacterium]